MKIAEKQLVCDGMRYLCQSGSVTVAVYVYRDGSMETARVRGPASSRDFGAALRLVRDEVDGLDDEEIEQ